jgi:hypothetical protein
LHNHHTLTRPRGTPFDYWKRTMNELSRRRAIGLGLALVALSAAARAAHASVLRALSLEELTRRAQLIVLATAVERQPRWHRDRRLILTDATLAVERVLKGELDADRRVIATVLGGEIDDLGVQVSGEANFTLGQRVIAFLQRNPGGRYRAVSMSQGALPVLERDQGWWVMPGGQGSALVERGGDGRLRVAPDALVQPVALEVLLDRIRNLVSPASSVAR